MAPSLSKKLQVYKFLKEREGKSYCAAEIASELGLNTVDARVYLYRLRKAGTIHDAETVGNVKFYTFRDCLVAVDSKELEEIKSLLAFLNVFFKQNTDLFVNDPAVLKFVADNKERFTRIEAVLGESPGGGA